MNSIVKKRGKSIQRAFNSEELIQKIVQHTDNIENLNIEFANVFSYYFCSIDKDTNYSYDELRNKYYTMINEGKELVEQRYYFQAFNGGCEKTYKNNGLDDISDLNFEVKEAMELLENELGKTQHPVGGVSKEQFCSFLTTDTEMLMRYALSYSPERLWYGPLEIKEGDSKPPIVIGETKKHYMLRTLESRIEDKTPEQRNRILKAGEVLFEEYGTKRLRIAIIPESEIKEYKANYSGIKRDDDRTISELAEEENGLWTETLQSGNNFKSEYGISVFDKITSDKFVTISMPDAFELTQIYAIQRGANIGDLVDSLTGEVIEKAKAQTSLSIIKKENIISKILNKIKNTYIGGTEDITFENKEQEHLVEPFYENNTHEVKESLTTLSERVKQFKEKCKEALMAKNNKRDMER